VALARESTVMTLAQFGRETSVAHEEDALVAQVWDLLTRCTTTGYQL
jgi:hypothetical protein